MRSLPFIFFILFVSAIDGFSQQSYKKDRTVCILDLTSRNGETNISYLHAADHMLKVWGAPYIINTSIDSAFKYKIVVASSRISSTTFSSKEVDSLMKYVKNGGTFIASGYSGSGNVAKGDSLNKIFGVSDTRSRNKLFRIRFLKNSSDPIYRWIDDQREDTLSIGNDTSTITSRSYTVSTAEKLAVYEDGSNAFIRNNYGSGTTYILGVTFRDMISLPQIDKDFHAERAYSNTFEPTMDAFMLFVKGIYTKVFPYAVWKHTIPDKRKAALIVTHDMDSQTSMDFTTKFSIYEYRKNIIGTYNITTRYFRDWLMGSFFLPNKNIVRLDSARINCGHVLGDHSIGHFPDMDNDKVFVVGERDHYDTAHYHPHYDGTITTGGAIYPEIQLSKQLIESQFPIKVRTWRSGNLAYPTVLNNLLDTLGFDFNSTYSANDVTSNFPFRGRTDQSNDGAYTRLLEIPMTVSDVFYYGKTSHSKSDTISQIDFNTKVTLWKDIIMKIANNYGVSVLLIHPNRKFKLDALKSLVTQLPLEEFDLRGMENFGDFWRYRDSVEYYTTYSNDTVKIIVPSSQLPIRRKLGFVVDNGQALDSTKLLVVNEKGDSIPHYRYNWYENGKYIMFEPASVWIDGDTIPDPEVLQPGFNIVNVYPNPFSNEVNVYYSSDQSGDMKIELYSALGSLIFTRTIPIEEGFGTLNLPEFSSLAKSLYFLRLSANGQRHTKKIIKE